jgi:hypothetical protein
LRHKKEGRRLDELLKAEHTRQPPFEREVGELLSMEDREGVDQHHDRLALRGRHAGKGIGKLILLLHRVALDGDAELPPALSSCLNSNSLFGSVRL